MSIHSIISSSKKVVNEKQYIFELLNAVSLSSGIPAKALFFKKSKNGRLIPKAKRGTTEEDIAKQCYIYIGAKTLSHFSKTKISKMLFLRDHTALIHGVKKFQNRLNTEEELAIEIYNNVRKKMSLIIFSEKENNH